MAAALASSRRAVIVARLSELVRRSPPDFFYKSVSAHDSYLRASDFRTALHTVHPSSRAATIAKLYGFIPLAELYACDWNHLLPGYPSVSHLSPAIRDRLISQVERVR